MVLSFLKEALASLRWQDVVDILLITFILYRLLVWIQKTRALRILIALAALGLLFFLGRLLGLFMTTWILQYLWTIILVILVVVFQSEIRQVLERMSPLRFFLGRPETLDISVLEEVVRAVFELAQKRIGALIVFRREDLLEDHLKGGIPLDGRVSYEVLSSLFLPTSPAHDGAVIIDGGRIVYLGCYLPLSDNVDLPRKFGTRHRAGIGLTERCDAISVIVSEERGEVMLAIGGGVVPITSADELRSQLESNLAKPKRTKGDWKEVLTTNLRTKSISFVLVLLLWIFIAGQQRAEIWLTLPLEYRNVPETMEMVGELVSRVEVGIRGPRGMISGISSDQVRAHLDLSQVSRGLNYIRLTTENIRFPLGTEVVKINPSLVRIRMEEVRTRSVPVKVKFMGKVAQPITLKTVEVEPATVLIQGPESTLARVREILTEPVDLSQVTEDTKLVVPLEINPPQLRLAPNQPFQVTVTLKTEKSLNRAN